MKKHIILITGAPRCGKSTIINSIKNRLTKSTKLGGIICSEMRNNLQERIGFQVNYYASQNYYPLSCELAKIDLHYKQDSQVTEYIKFRKYLVNIFNIEKFIVPAIKNAILTENIVILDEIADMQLFCQDFKKCIEDEVINSKKLEIITISEELYNSNKEFVTKLKSFSLGLFYLKPGVNFEQIINEVCDLINIFMNDKLS